MEKVNVLSAYPVTLLNQTPYHVDVTGAVEHTVGGRIAPDAQDRNVAWYIVLTRATLQGVFDVQMGSLGVVT
jgi:hypothetical protein